MANITRETFEANGEEAITDKFGKLCLNERHVQQQLGLKNCLHLQTNMIKNIKSKDLD